MLTLAGVSCCSVLRNRKQGEEHENKALIMRTYKADKRVLATKQKKKIMTRRILILRFARLNCTLQWQPIRYEKFVK